MIRPSPTDLLTGIASVLRESVSAELPAGDTRNQVRAAAVILRRLAAVWDRVVPTLRAENRDIEETLAELAGSLADAGCGPSADSPKETASEPRFEEIAERNRVLQERLADIHDALTELDDCELKARIEARLRALHRRNLARDRELTGR